MSKAKRSPKSTKSTKASGRGRKPLTVTLTAKQLAAQVRALLGKLAATKDQEAKQRIRRALRVRGHRGGLRAVEAQ